jgi:hypothetical protein
MTESTLEHAAPPEVDLVPGASGSSWRRRLSPANASIVYIYLAGFVLFSLWIPDLWLSWTTHKSVLNIQFAVPAIVAVGLVVPLLTGASISRSPVS